MRSGFYACIFDLDGVIVDTARYHFEAWRSLAGSLGFELTEEQNEQLKGVSRMRSLDIVLGIGGIQCSGEEKQRMADQKNRHYVQLIGNMDSSEILPGALDFLERVKRAGIRTATASASKNAGTILDALQISPLFDTVVDGTKVSRAKPDPEVFLRAAAELDIPPTRCLVFEDAVAGVEAAHRGGMLCVGIGSPAVLGDAELVIPGFQDLTDDTAEELLSGKLFSQFPVKNT